MMDIQIGIFDLADEDRPLALAKFFSASGAACYAIGEKPPHDPFSARKFIARADDGYFETKTEKMEGFDLFLIHGNNAEQFDRSVGPLVNDRMEIWYGGIEGTWKDYETLRNRGKEVHKIYKKVVGDNIPLSENDRVEILAYIRDPENAAQPSSFCPPPDSGALMALSTFVQCELFRQLSAVEEWLKDQELLRSHRVPDSAKEFVSRAKGIYATAPGPADWAWFLKSGSDDSTNGILAEAKHVSRSLESNDHDTDRLVLSIRALLSECSEIPKVETLVSVYDSLYLLEKHGRER